MTPITLRADCTQCASLCCVALSFERSSLFAFDKEAGEPCAHLSRCGACRIHGERAARGFAGCASYDCLGAGQYVTQAMFGGRSWTADRALLGPMMEAFAIVREIHAVVLALQSTSEHAMPADTGARLTGYLRALQPEVSWTPDELKSARLALLLREARKFLRASGDNKRA
jgi:hypothetical protein